MTQRSRPETARMIADIRRLQLQRAVSDSARARVACDLAAERFDRAVVARDAHVDAWRQAADGGSLSIPFLDNFACAFDKIASELEAERETVHRQRQAFEASKQALVQFDQLAERAEDDATRADRRHRQRLEERRIFEREMKPYPFTEDR